MNIQAQKAIIIEQFKQVNDENLMNAIKSLLDCALEKEEEKVEISDEKNNTVEVLAVISTYQNPEKWIEKTDKK